MTVDSKGIRDWLARMLAAGQRVIAPQAVDGEARLAQLTSADEFRMPDVNTVNSIKEFFFPKVERLAAFRRVGRRVEVESGAAGGEPFVVFGVRPCDAGSLEIMDKVFSWDEVDEDWSARRKAAVVVAVACERADQYCFCTSVGLAPDSRAGADVMLLPMVGGGFRVEGITEKGKKFLGDSGPRGSGTAGGEVMRFEVGRKFDAGEVGRELEANFESAVWREASERCIGCGVCTYYCPTCHCFDIQDEADGGRGARFRTWDSCSFRQFTRHASGHNPRPDQASRWRQRIMHKFLYYPERFGAISCTGCGRCGRECPVDLGVEETVRGMGEGMR